VTSGTVSTALMRFVLTAADNLGGDRRTLAHEAGLPVIATYQPLTEGPVP
jgi:hypothetical protein